MQLKEGDLIIWRDPIQIPTKNMYIIHKINPKGQVIFRQNEIIFNSAYYDLKTLNKIIKDKTVIHVKTKGSKLYEVLYG